MPPDQQRIRELKWELAIAKMESFLGTLKTESLHHYCFATREQARQTIFEYIEVFYTRTRRHAKIGNQMPADFAKRFYADSKMAA